MEKEQLMEDPEEFQSVEAEERKRILGKKPTFKEMDELREANRQQINEYKFFNPRDVTKIRGTDKVGKFNAPAVSGYRRVAKSNPKSKKVTFFKRGGIWGIVVSNP